MVASMAMDGDTNHEATLMRLRFDQEQSHEMSGLGVGFRWSFAFGGAWSGQKREQDKLCLIARI